MRAVCASLLCVVCLLVGSAAAHADVPVRSAGGFVDSVGVDTHLTFANTSYGDWSRLVGLLGVLGVRHLADGAYGNPAASWAGFNQLFDSRVQLAAAAGLRFTFAMGKPGYQGGSIAQLVSVMSGPLRSAIEAVADPNEFDTSSGLTDWRDPLVSYDRQLYAAVKASPALRSVPVIGPSLVGDGAPGALGDQQASLDAGAIHPYTGAKSPTVAYTQAQLARIRRVSGDKPVWATEAGFSTALNAPAGQQPVSEYTDAVYLLRELLGNFAAQIKRTFAYELIDDLPDPSGANLQDHFGLLRADYTPKPAFTALANLLALVGRQSPAQLSPLALSVSQAPSDLQKLVLQQGPDSYVIALWRQASVWNPSTRRPITVPAEPVTLTLPDGAQAATADPITTRTLTPQTITGHRLQIQLGPNPLIIHITTGQQ
jgi:hypothetical protein